MTSPAFFSEKYSNLAFEIIKYVFPEPVGPQKRDTLVFPKRLTCLKRKRLAALIAASLDFYKIIGCEPVRINRKIGSRICRESVVEII